MGLWTMPPSFMQASNAAAHLQGCSVQSVQLEVHATAGQV